MIHNPFQLDFHWIIVASPFIAAGIAAIAGVIAWIRWCINDELRQEDRCAEAKARHDIESMEATRTQHNVLDPQTATALLGVIFPPTTIVEAIDSAEVPDEERDPEDD